MEQHLRHSNKSRCAPVKQFIDAAKITNVKWLWKHRVPLGCLTSLAGEQGDGKSTMLYDIIARLSTGKEFPDCQPGIVAKTLILSCEDHANDTAGPRLLSAGADITKIIKWEATFDITTPGTPEQLEQLLKDDPEIKLVMVEPIYEQVTGDSNQANNVAAILGQFQAIAHPPVLR